jgi:hypothetical protein
MVTSKFTIVSMGIKLLLLSPMLSRGSHISHGWPRCDRRWSVPGGSRPGFWISIEVGEDDVFVHPGEAKLETSFGRPAVLQLPPLAVARLSGQGTRNIALISIIARPCPRTGNDLIISSPTNAERLDTRQFPCQVNAGAIGAATRTGDRMFKTGLIGAALAGALIAVAAGARAAPVTAPGSAASTQSLRLPLEQVYWWNGHYYPYRWHGHYYRYHWHGHYYPYYWGGHYYYHRGWYHGGWRYW